MRTLGFVLMGKNRSKGERKKDSEINNNRLLENFSFYVFIIMFFFWKGLNIIANKHQIHRDNWLLL